VDLIAHFHSNESFQVPAVIEPRTLALAALIVLMTGLVSTYALRRQVYALDLVAVLKARE
jgi:putative ABC transport system permease protein